MPYPHRYYSRKTTQWGRHPTLEIALTVIVIVAVIAALLIFLLVYHTLPFRSGGPP